MDAAGQTDAPPTGGAQRSLERLPWPAIERAAARPGSTVIWPFGAVEQHGPHLPIGTDGLFSERVLDGVLERLPEALPIWRLPLSSYGFSPEHRGFPGTLSLSAEALIALVMAVGRDLAGAGFDRLVLFNGHGGQIALLQVAARQLRAAQPAMAVLPCFLWSGPQGVASLLPEPERHEGLHAGLAETSLMLHLAPELVGPQRPHDGRLGREVAAVAPAGWSLEGSVPNAWLTADLSSSGVIGDARSASAALGEALYEALVIGWSQLLGGLLSSEWPPKG
ncbi:creatininase family protein [Synechococcus sp. CS-1325]|uniref:creatininase family protein n=1 Tax=Synechococcus sp. CS-1325 TaxID=2847979 RepID=UPI000DB73DDE|nr:creatininase family protein [Synechococcus sp. CS-1325]MCT0200458.1 creatininase family protein [Synechococcus sp. CS-1325]PZV02511.1 MAG: creatininase [Cyanobium sp.]